MSMQMDAEFQKEQNGTIFVWVGALGGGYWGGGCQGPLNQKIGLTSNTFFCGASWGGSKKLGPPRILKTLTRIL